jgi:DNA-binding transcriptional regulator YiaG
MPVLCFSRRAAIVPNIHTLKAEIQRLAAKEAKTLVAKVRQATTEYRRENAQLRRLLRQQEREIRALKKQADKPAEEGPLVVRFSAKSVRSQRERLGFSVEDYAKLVGVSVLTIRHWENDAARPRKAQLAALVAVRGIAKREARRRLAEMAE